MNILGTWCGLGGQDFVVQHSSTIPNHTLPDATVTIRQE